MKPRYLLHQFACYPINFASQCFFDPALFDGKYFHNYHGICHIDFIVPSVLNYREYFSKINERLF